MKFISNLTKESAKKFEFCCKKIDPNCKIDIRKELYDYNGNRWYNDKNVAFYVKSNIIKSCLHIMESEYYKNYKEDNENDVLYVPKTYYVYNGFKILTFNDIIKNKKEENMETKYELIKKLFGKEIVENACKRQFEIFVKKFGFYDEVE